MNLAAVDLNLLVALEALLGERSVTRAAARVGLSQPAMSNALGRLRELFGDPLLVRSGQRMVPTPRAEALRGDVSGLLVEIRETLLPEPPFDPARSRRTFTVAAGNVAAGALALVPRFLSARQAEAPGVDVRFPDLVGEPASALADGTADLALVAQVEIPEGLHREPLVEQPLVGVARRDHPALGPSGGAPDLDAFLALDHLQVAAGERRLDGVDWELERLGRHRRVAFTVADFLHAPLVAAVSDLVVALPEGFARLMAGFLPLRAFRLPLELPPYRVMQAWHDRTHGDPGCRWLRAFLRRLAAGDGRPDLG